MTKCTRHRIYTNKTKVQHRQPATCISPEKNPGGPKMHKNSFFLSHVVKLSNTLNYIIENIQVEVLSLK